MIHPLSSRLLLLVASFLMSLNVYAQTDTLPRIDSTNQTGCIKGHVSIDYSHKPHGPLKVYVEDRNSRDYFSAGSVLVDSLGNYLICNIKPGKYRVACAGDGIDEEGEDVTVRVNDTLIRDFNVKIDFTGKPAPVFSPGVNIGYRSTAELMFGVIRYKDGPRLNWHTDMFTLGSEINFRIRDLIIGPKFTYNHTFGAVIWGIPVGGSLIYYTDFSNAVVYARPHAGFEVFTVLKGTVGYNFPLNDDQTFSGRVPAFTVSLSFAFYNIDKYVL